MRLLYMQQLLPAKVPHQTPPADTTEVPIVVLVGYEAVGKGVLLPNVALPIIIGSILHEIILRYVTSFRNFEGT